MSISFQQKICSLLTMNKKGKSDQLEVVKEAVIITTLINNIKSLMEVIQIQELK